MDKYTQRVIISKEFVLNGKTTDKDLKTELYSDFVDGNNSCLSTIIDNLARSCPDKQKQAEFGKMISSHFADYLKYISIDRSNMDICEHEDPDFMEVQLEFNFDHDKALTKATKDFKKLSKTNAIGR